MMSKELMLAKALFGGGGGITPTGDINITANGTYDVTDKAGAIVAVPNSYAAADEGKVVENGALVAQTSQNISANGTYDTTNKNQVVVAVPAAGMDTLVDRSITSYASHAVGKIGSYAFHSCKSLASVSAPNAAKVEPYSFSGCIGLTNVNLPKITSIGDYGFNSCKALTAADFPLCTIIGSSGFNGCFELASINFPACSSLGSNVFYSCAELTEAKLPSLSGNIPNQTFKNCTKLKIADFGPGVNSIGYTPFDACSALMHLVFRKGDGVVSLPGANYLIGNPIYDGTGYIYVPAALVASYQAATNWTQFSSQFRALESYTVDGTTTGDLDPTKI